MEKELIYEFRILIYSNKDTLIASVNCGEFQFPSDEKIKDALEEHGGDYARVERTYRIAEIPFT